MDYYIWDKKSPLLGVCANVMMDCRVDFKYDDVIVIHKKGERENVVMVETKEGLKLNYDIDSDNADVVGFVTAVILGEDSPETIREKLEKIPEEKKEPEKTVEEISVDDYAKLIDNILSSYSEEKIQSDDDEFNIAIPLSGQYRDPFCRVIDKSDIPDDVYDKKLQLVIKHAFVTDVDNPIDLKCMYEKRLELDQLNDEREKHAHEGNYDLVEITTHKIESMQEEFMDSCDATLRLEAEVIYQYDDNMIVHLTNGQSMIINRAAVDSFRMNAISYEKRKEHSDEKYKVFYKSIDLELNSDLNEFREINNSIFIVTI
jgi:hypothetical protein